MKQELITPCFIVDQNELKNNIDKMHKALKETWDNYIIGYSYKTNSLPWIIKFLKENNVYAEVVSDFEYKLAQKIGCSEEEIIFNGPNKGKDIFIHSIKNGSIINIDSFREIEWISKLELKKPITIGIRVNFNLEQECPGETAMGIEGGRFGFSLENGDLEKAINKLNSLPNVKVVGIHLHNSTKTRSLNIYKTLAKKACEISKLFKYELDYVDIGGGFFGGLETKPSYYEYMKTISLELSRVFNNKKTKLIVEPGAALIASPVSFLCEVVDVKDTYSKRIVTINGSRNNIDPFFMKNSYIYEIIKLNENSSRRNIEEQVVCGYTCLDNDRIMKIKNKDELDIGDKLVFKKVGAYTICLTPIFIEAFPKVYVRNEDNRYECVRDSWDVNEYLQKSVF